MGSASSALSFKKLFCEGGLGFARAVQACAWVGFCVFCCLRYGMLRMLCLGGWLGLGRSVSWFLRTSFNKKGFSRAQEMNNFLSFLLKKNIL